MIRVWMAFEVVGTSPDVSKEALLKHLDKLSSLPQVKERRREMLEPKETEFRGKKAYSVAGEIEAEIESFFDLLNIIMVYGPSAVEVLEPEKIEVGISEMQEICNVVAGLVHKFAAAGIGGVVINR